jgi:uncharacterized damage-inducible protein DinB
MDAKLSTHLGRVRHLREAFAEANERLVARLRAATPEAAAAPPAEGWSAAQIGWHVAAVTNRFAGLISGDGPGATAVPAGFVERPWQEVLSGVPARLQAPASATPPPAVTRDAAIALLEESGMRLARALDRLTPERGAGMGVTHPVTGAISVYQIGDWAIAHVIRHNQQAKRVLQG